MRLSFYGAVGTVTGSKYLLEINQRKFLIDCGLFQGFKQLRLRNWATLPISPEKIDAVILTHAHIDHSGYCFPSAPVSPECGCELRSVLVSS
jgi:metallo-beta-lactamase family protein